MAKTEKPQEAEPKTKRSKLPLLLGLMLGCVLGGGGFYATWTGLILGPKEVAETAGPAPGALPDIAFLPVDSVVISLGPASSSRHLRFTAQLEVANPHAAEVAAVMPRILDVLNSYLRAVSISELEEPSSMARLRAQMLRRVQIVTGEGRVRDLLVTEFVLN
ncbi:flagellar basal body-associated FliL family protein [Xinfangfangia sp. CPCC 101601]|uniref:Flagellar protein FliL n=1 Tax=Pseudogemmobacter lacusdianii TaxID=3069608 RepID=A0ABU0VU77_9RHOB|nr:flagellar basal body-associated FliL family protein [Xinfangfangia sp. CPCC 101601]MDQ2065284.1 flagellar basal body-associated FliL family protein [Xinfangfangia sp. CPCC 101601]